MKILFCKISSMKYYKGVCNNDQAYNGGSYVDKNGRGNEEYNFLEINFNENDDIQNYCLGFVETKSTNGINSNQLHIEKISGCKLLKNELIVDNVLVVWCATSNTNETTVVGWYKNATVFREYQSYIYNFEDDTEEERYYNIKALASDCVLLPQGERHKFIWNAPLLIKTKSFGFYKSLIWYATETSASNFIKKLVKNIEEYDGENWLCKYPED